MKVIEIIEHLQSNYNDNDILAVHFWNIDDITLLEKEMCISLTHEDKISILELFEDDLDSNHGLTWKGLKTTIEDYNLAPKKAIFNTTILQHNIEFWLIDYPEFSGELPEMQKEHIQNMIIEGYNQGELCLCADKTDNQYNGWWKMI